MNDWLLSFTGSFSLGEHIGAGWARLKLRHESSGDTFRIQFTGVGVTAGFLPVSWSVGKGASAPNDPTLDEWTHFRTKNSCRAADFVGSGRLAGGTVGAGGGASVTAVIFPPAVEIDQPFYRGREIVLGGLGQATGASVEWFIGDWVIDGYYTYEKKADPRRLLSNLPRGHPVFEPSQYRLKEHFHFVREWRRQKSK
jgi:hypothetical protein